uniref:Uncharacterized protein n=1 Tax=Nelumbo nucifera TaxID=4432 RepID=A0A822YAN3_NELNU|nr:TPA_asm: hypothetical protein HUJ06_030830 [Nelumbo nucifera]
MQEVRIENHVGCFFVMHQLLMGVGTCCDQFSYFDELQVRRHFRPELLNRPDEIVIIDPLSHEQLRKVARLRMRDVASRLAERDVEIGISRKSGLELRHKLSVGSSNVTS